MQGAEFLSGFGRNSPSRQEGPTLLASPASARGSRNRAWKFGRCMPTSSAACVMFCAERFMAASRNCRSMFSTICRFRRLNSSQVPGTSAVATLGRGLADLPGQVVPFDPQAAVEHGDPLDDVSQFPDVARPGVDLHLTHGLARKSLCFHAHLTREVPQEAIGQEGNVARPLAQRRERDGHDVQPVVQVGAEGALS